MSGTLGQNVLIWGFEGGDDTYARGDVPLFLAVVVSHDFIGTYARLANAGTICHAESLCDDCTEVWQLFDLRDRQWLGDVGEGTLKLPSQFCEDPWVGKEVDGRDLGLKSAFRKMKRTPHSRKTHTQNPRRGFCACDREVLGLLEQTERFFVLL